MFDSIDSSQAFREGGFQAFDVIVVVVHLLLKISHAQTHGLVVPAEKVKEILNHNYEELSSTVRLPGFRRGRGPRRLLE
mgnify:CR=1 FL=1